MTIALRIALYDTTRHDTRILSTDDADDAENNRGYARFSAWSGRGTAVYSYPWCNVMFYTYSPPFSAFSISVLSLQRRRRHRRRLVSHGPDSFTPSRYSVFPLHICTCTYDPLHATPVSRLRESSSSRPQASYGNEHYPYVPLAHRYALVVVFNEYKSVRSTTTTTSTMMAAAAATTAVMVVAGVTTAMMTAA